MAESSKIKTLMSDHERYVTTFAEYCKRTKKYDVLRDWISSDFPEKVVNSLGVKDIEELRMLGVGSGSGFVETCALKQLVTKWSKVTHTVLEPNSDLLDQFKELAAKEKDNLPGVSFDWKQKTVEEFKQESADQTSKYHFIMVVQSIYYVDDLEGILKYLTSLLAKGGMMVIVMVSENSVMWRIANRFPEFQNEKQLGICTKHIEEILAANGIKFATDEIEARMDSTGCFVKDSKEAELLIDFITQVAYLKSQRSEAFYNEVVEYVKTDQVSLPPTADGRTWFRCNYDAIYVTK
ncbi:histamine N-methyltransferase A-like [Antedon mediterranea]|uniref:histamine N-methyltransferase A-like n=1 Tax=Antedon mediterranea TaxID=105859 RepID=UPI003AF96E54